MSYTGPTGYNMPSNFIDSGYGVTGQNLNGTTGNGNSTFYSVSSADLYNSCVQCGVYMINGGYGNTDTTGLYHVPCSASNVVFLGIPDNVDDAYIVYPGFGIQLYYNTGYSGTSSNICYNTYNFPVIFGTSGGSSTPWVPRPNVFPIYDTGTTTTYPCNNTSSIKVFFRGTEIKLPGISYTS
jgi:hypothetical protein